MWGSLKKNMQKHAKMINTEPMAIHTMAAGVNLETIKRIIPTAKEGIINGKPSLRIDICTFLRDVHGQPPYKVAEYEVFCNYGTIISEAALPSRA
jgi:hypothetical protein